VHAPVDVCLPTLYVPFEVCLPKLCFPVDVCMPTFYVPFDECQPTLYVPVDVCLSLPERLNRVDDVSYIMTIIPLQYIDNYKL
jgi:hypothetical protein